LRILITAQNHQFEGPKSRLFIYTYIYTERGRGAEEEKEGEVEGERGEKREKGEEGEREGGREGGRDILTRQKYSQAMWAHDVKSLDASISRCVPHYMSPSLHASLIYIYMSEPYI
jgi:hypothetical protein